MATAVFLLLVGLVAGLGVLRLVRALRPRPADLAWLAALVPVALLAVRPYLGDALVGAGDAQHYALQAADFAAQARAGGLPVLVGQSEYAFNGGVHTLRTAPYFTHLAGLLDALTARRLSPVALQNLAVATTALLAAWAAYAAALLASGGRRAVAAALAALYVLSPATVGPPLLHDMFATYMAMPWIPLAWAGIVESLRRDGHPAAPPLAAGALALTWYAHSPLGAWMTLLAGAAWVWRCGREGGSRAFWASQVRPLLLLAALAAWIAASVGTLDPAEPTAATAADHAFSAERLAERLRAEFVPFLAGRAEAGIQLGWSLWLVAGAVAVLGLRSRHRPAVGAALLLLPLAALLFPLPGITEALWRLLPLDLLGLSTWPAQRLLPVLAGGLLAVGAALGRDLAPAAKVEPLVTIGRTGAADCVYVVYEDADHVRIGVDHWGVGGPLSAPLPLRRGRPQALEVAIGGLETRRAGPAAPGRLRVLLDGRVVFDQTHPFHPASPREVAVGANPVGSSTAAVRFSGRILGRERLPAGR